MNKKFFTSVIILFFGLFIYSSAYATVSISVTAKPYLAVVNLSGVGPSQKVTIYVSNDPNLNKETYSGSKDVLTDDSGNASAEFILSPNKAYKAYTSISGTPYESFTTPRDSTPSQATISSFGPTSGLVGTDISIVGTNINDYVEVTLGNKTVIPKTNFGGMMTITVPSGATSGRIVIKTNSNGTATSTSDFVVTSGNTVVPPSVDTNTGDALPNTDDEISDIESSGIVPRCNVGDIDKNTGQYKTPCNFTFFIKLINRIIKFLLFVIATPLIALIIMYTAYLYLTAGGKTGQVEKVRHILFNAVVGYVIALAAWLIINTIISSLNIDPSINTFMEKIDK
jgi:hypothetical protein